MCTPWTSENRTVLPSQASAHPYLPCILPHRAWEAVTEQSLQHPPTLGSAPRPPCSCTQATAAEVHPLAQGTPTTGTHCNGASTACLSSFLGNQGGYCKFLRASAGTATLQARLAAGRTVCGTLHPLRYETNIFMMMPSLVNHHELTCQTNSLALP